MVDKTSASSIVVITAEFPYGLGEVFMEKEISAFATQFEQVYIFPQSTKGELVHRKLPDNCIVLLDIADHYQTKFRDLWQNSFLILNWLFVEFSKSGRSYQVLFRLKALVRTMLQVFQKSRKVEKQFKELNGSVFYSVWMDDGSLLLAYLKKKKIILKYSFRLHGYDLFDERREGRYMPFRIVNFKAADRIFILSQFGKKYLLARFPDFAQKYIVNYSGLPDNGINPIPFEQEFVIVSCSNVIPLKNVDKIARVMGLLDFPVNWFHFGSGEDFEIVSKIAANFPSHIRFNLNGRVDNGKIIDFYKAQPVDLFIHLSSSEGLGMAIVEAQSFGIPALIVNSQGTSETCSTESGVIISNDCSEKEIAEQISVLKMSKEKLIMMRPAARSFYLKNFKSPDNYLRFIDILKS
jgi:glycosyltransferase involved in cell wall biosynthesis